MLLISTKAQAWYTDFIIAMLMFAVTLTIYFVYTTNLSKEDINSLNDIVSEAKLVSSSLVSGGYPSDWNNNTVKRIGLTDGNQKINTAKLRSFANLPYNYSKKILGTVYDYTISFEDVNGTILNIGGFCGKSSSEIDIRFDVKAAYYYKEEELFEDFIVENFNADIYSYDDPVNDMDALISNINNYGLVAIEDPEISPSDWNAYRVGFQDYVSSGGLLMISGYTSIADGREMLGVKFYKKSGEASTDQNATVINEDDFLSLNTGEKVEFAQAYYVINDSIESENFTRVAKFDDSSFDEENNAIASWNYGSGSAYYFSDFDAEYFSGNFIQAVQDATLYWVGGNCIINMSTANIANLVNINRFLSYNKANKVDIAKMVLYLWS